MIDKPFAIIEAPSALGLFPRGVETLPDALLAAGVAERLHARRAGRVEPPPYNPKRDPRTRMLNPHGIAGYSVALADAVGQVLGRGEFPVVLGGDCSILLGNLLALRRRRKRPSLLFLDGHADCWTPDDEPRGEAASMDLALALGFGPALVTDLEGYAPLVREADVALVGRRDVDGDADGPVPQPPPSVLDLPLGAVRARRRNDRGCGGRPPFAHGPRRLLGAPRRRRA